MAIENVARGLSFVQDDEVGDFLPWIAAQNYNGPINLSSTGYITIDQILKYIESATGKKAIINVEKGVKVPFSEFDEDTFSLDMSKAKMLGWKASDINEWFWKLLDEYIAAACATNKKD